MSNNVPGPALVMPPVPAMTLDTVRVAPVRGRKMESAAADVTTPPLMAAVTLSSTPPLLRVTVVRGLMVMPPPVSIVREFNVVAAAMAPGLLVSNTLAVVVNAFKATSVLVLSWRIRAVEVVAAAAASAVAKLVVPPEVTSAQGMMAFVLVPVAPVPPTKVKPVVVDARVATLAPAAEPRLVPVKSAVPLLLRVTAPKARPEPAAPGVIVTTLWPRLKVTAPIVSVKAAALPV